MSFRNSFCLLLVFCGTVSCVDYTEDFTIKTNGSGTIHSVISLNENLADDDPNQLKTNLEKMFASGKGLSLASYTVTNQGDRQITDFTVAFDHVGDLKSALSGGDNDVAKYFGTFEAEEQDDRYVMKRTIDLTGQDKNSDQEKGKLGGAIKKLMAKALLKDSYLTYRMTFPTAVLKANAPNIEAGTHTVEWQFSVGDAVKAPLVMTAEIQKPPFLKWLLGAGIAVLIFGGAFLLWRRRR